MASVTVDPYEFNDDDYVPSRENDLNDSFWERFFGLEPHNKENTDVTPSQSKKRKADPSRWIRNARKAALASGQETTDRRGRLVPARQTGPDCNCGKLQCFKKVDLETRNELLADFNAMGDYNVQNNYLYELIEARGIKRRNWRKATGASMRSCSYVYFVQDRQSNRLQVCQRAFCSIHGISEQRVRTVRNKQAHDLSDKRGRHTNRPNRISEETNQKVRNHILSFPTEALCCSARKELPVSRMYQLYLQTNEPTVWAERQQKYLRCRQQTQEPEPAIQKRAEVSEHLYRQIFNAEFNWPVGAEKQDIERKS